MVKIRLKRIGKKREPFYRLVVTDSRNKRSGRAIEEIGKYYPLTNPSHMEVISDRVQYWLSVGAQPTEPVQRILEILGEWSKFQGGDGQSKLKIAEPKANREDLIQEASDRAEAIKAEVHAKVAADQLKEKSASKKIDENEKSQEEVDASSKTSAEEETPINTTSSNDEPETKSEELSNSQNEVSSETKNSSEEAQTSVSNNEVEQPAEIPPTETDKSEVPPSENDNQTETDPAEVK